MYLKTICVVVYTTCYCGVVVIITLFLHLKVSNGSYHYTTTASLSTCNTNCFLNTLRDVQPAMYLEKVLYCGLYNPVFIF